MRLWLAGLLVLLATSAAWATDKVALVIGIGAYQNAPALANPAHDAKAMAAALTALGFQVIEGEDVDKAGFEGKVRDFADAAFDAKVAMFFYAGHGMQVNGVNYLIPTDAKLATPASLEFETVNLDAILRYAHGSDRIALAFIDACRDNPFAQRPSRGFDRIGPGLAAPSAGAGGTLIAFATSPGTTADEGSGYDSPFTTALLKEIATPGVEIQQLLTRVTADVYDATAGEQQPWHNSSLRTEFYLGGPPPPPQPNNPVVVTVPPPDEQLWAAISGTDDIARLQLFLDAYPDSTHTQEARDKIAVRQEFERTHVAYTGPLDDSTNSGRTQSFVVNTDRAIARTLPDPAAPLKLLWPKDTSLTTQGRVGPWLLATATDGTTAFVQRGDLILSSRLGDRDELVAAAGAVDTMFDRIKQASGVLGPKVGGVYGFGCASPSIGGLEINSVMFALKKYYWTEGNVLYQASLRHPDSITHAPLVAFKSITIKPDGAVKFYKANWGRFTQVIGFKNGKVLQSQNSANTQFEAMSLCATQATGRSTIKGWYTAMLGKIAAPTDPAGDLRTGQPCLPGSVPPKS